MNRTVTPLQAAAMLLLVRLSIFFCADTPFTAAYALSTAAVSALGAAAALILVTIGFHFSQIAMRIFRILDVFAGIWLLIRIYILLTFLHMPHRLISFALVLLCIAYALSRPLAACARTAVLLLILTAAGFLLLPVSGIGTAHVLHLFLPEHFPTAFLRELRSSVDFLLLPVLLRSAKSPKQSLGFWYLGRGLVLPAFIAFGAMQNGRLTKWLGSPFFLLLARTPLSDAVRTDGFWMLTAIACGIVAAAALLHPRSKSGPAEITEGTF